MKPELAKLISTLHEKALLAGNVTIEHLYELESLDVRVYEGRKMVYKKVFYYEDSFITEFPEDNPYLILEALHAMIDRILEEREIADETLRVVV